MKQSTSPHGAQTAEGIHIRPGTEKDVPVLWELIRELAEYEQLSKAFRAKPEDLRRYGFGPTPAFYTLLAFTGQGHPVGFALYFYTFSTFEARPTLFVEDVFVRPSWRRKGIGRALFHRLASIARRQGCARMEWMVLRWNQPAQRFFASLGARMEPDWLLCRLDGEALAHLAEQNALSEEENGAQ